MAQLKKDTTAAKKEWARPKLVRMDAADAEVNAVGPFAEFMDPTSFMNMS